VSDQLVSPVVVTTYHVTSQHVLDKKEFGAKNSRAERNIETQFSVQESNGPVEGLSPEIVESAA